eukprot:2913422-Prorocentrum_lima.AAC.1
MTSSLVGSEMCIRDSVNWVSGNTKRGGARVFKQVGHGQCILELVWLQPVSYTHLTLPTICSV